MARLALSLLAAAAAVVAAALPVSAIAAPPASVGTTVSPSGVGALKMNMPISQAMQLLGTPSSQDNDPMTPQYTATYKADGIELVSGSQTGKLTWLILTGRQFTLPGGVHVGSPAKAAAKALLRHGFDTCSAGPDGACYDRNVSAGTQTQLVFGSGKVKYIEVVSLPTGGN